MLAGLLRLAWVHACGAFDRLTSRLALAWSAAARRHDATPRVYRVYAFNEDDLGDGGDFYKELPPCFLDFETWEQDVREHTGWTSVKVEVRYEVIDPRNHQARKYRMVLRPGSTCAIPDATRIRRHGGIMSARLQGARGSTIDTDVTARVLKYQGPRGDFHAAQGVRLRVQDMFPFDDHVDNAARFSHLRLVNARGRVVDLPYTQNPDVCVRGDHTPGAVGTGSNGSSTPPPEDGRASGVDVDA